VNVRPERAEERLGSHLAQGAYKYLSFDRTTLAQHHYIDLELAVLNKDHVELAQKLALCILFEQQFRICV